MTAQQTPDPPNQTLIHTRIYFSIGLYLNGFDTRPLSPSPSRAESISIRPDNFPTSWFYIKSAASGLVVDIEHGYFTDPMKAGARAEMNHQKIDNGDGRHSLLELQLWRYEAGFLINRRTGFVLDIQGGKETAEPLTFSRPSLRHPPLGIIDKRDKRDKKIICESTEKKAG